MKPTEDTFEDALEQMIIKALYEDDDKELVGKLAHILYHTADHIEELDSRHIHKGGDRGN